MVLYKLLCTEFKQRAGGFMLLMHKFRWMLTESPGPLKASFTQTLEEKQYSNIRGFPLVQMNQRKEKNNTKFTSFTSFTQELPVECVVSMASLTLEQEVGFVNEGCIKRR